VACASAGNTSASLASYAARAELPALVFVPKGKVAGGKLAQTIAYGARTLFVRGGFDECLALARSASSELGIQLLNSVNPFRIEGQKTIVFELLEQLGWNVPDWIALPAGNLGNTSAFGKALRDARAAGLIDRMPRLCAVQAEGAAPFARSFEGAFAERVTVEPETIATAIRIGAPASWNRAVRAIRDTNGVVTSVSVWPSVITSRSYTGATSKRRSTSSSISRCCAVAIVMHSKRASDVRAWTTGAIFTASGRVPKTAATRSLSLKRDASPPAARARER